MKKICLLLVAIFSNSYFLPAQSVESSIQLIEESLQFATSIDQLETQMFNQINKKRTSRGLKPLISTTLMHDLARQHSKDMAAKRVPFGHAGFDKRADRLFATGKYSNVAENVAFTSSRTNPVSIMVNAWMNSPDHRKHILGNYQHTGVGIALGGQGYYATQLFGRKK